MKVTRLEINGFKSFAERTLVDFPEGLCAVVGPNGCGKSNVVDAIRWVLGEQSAKTLRGRSMEDVLFNGADTMGPAGFSEVSLVFENEGDVTAGAFADLTEIMVTRRLYRSGESKYMINRVDCRLKDIQQLFMDTGLGNRDYAIIEQGRVAAFIESRPQDRRLWLEEAAGITRYKNQKKVSLRKMQAARDNLDRLQDIIVEIETHMARLKRQAQKAERHRELRKKILDLDLAASSFAHDQHTSGLKEIEADSQAVGAQLLLAQQRLTGLETDQETLRVRLVAAEQEIDTAGSAKLAAQGAIQKTENELTLMGREAENTKRLIERFTSEREDLLAKVRLQEREQETAQRVVSRFQNRRDQAAATLAGADEEVAGLSAQLTALEQSLDQAKSTVVEHLGNINQTSNRLADLDRTEHDLGRRAAQAEAREQSLQQEIDEQTLGRDQAASQAEHLESNLAVLDKEIDGLLAGLDQARPRIKDLQAKLNQGTRRRVELAASVDAMGLSLDSHDWAQAGVRAVLDGAEKNKHDIDIMGLVADHLTVQPGSEEVVEAALGQDLQAVMVRRVDDARKLAQWIEEKGLGRVRVLALDSLTAPSQVPPLESTPLGELVQPVDGFDALWVLLNPVGWCEDTAEAWLASASLRPGQAVVSQSGQRMDRVGGVLVGRNEAGSVLARRNQLAERKQELAQAQQAQEDTARQLAETEAEAAGLEKELTRLEAVRRERRQEAAEARRQLVSLNESLAAKARQLEALGFDSEDIHGELARINDQRHSLQQRLEDLEDGCQEVEDALQATRGGLEQRRMEIEEARAAQGEARLNAANLDGEANRARQDLTRLSQELARRQERIESLASEIAGAKKNVDSLGSRREQLQVSLAGLYEDLDRQEESLQEARDLYAKAQVKAADLDAGLKQARAELKITEGQSQEISLAQHKLTLERDQLAEAVMERCRVDLTTDCQSYLPQGAFDLATSEERLAKFRTRLHRMGPVNMEAISEHEALSKRHGFLTQQREDLDASLEDLKSAIRKINRTSRKRFTDTLEQANLRLDEVYPILFEGGKATLELEEGIDPLDAGLHIMVELPGKKIRTLESLSGGEKALTAVAVLFALFLIKPAPFCILDEVDAPLDEANIGRFHKLLQRLVEKSQIIMITHNRRTMEMVEMLYGVTMEQKGISKILSVTLSQGESLAA